MIVRFPDHYFDFECMGGPCPDNCCIGDELVIDEDTFLYYQSVEGEFGDHLRDVLKDAVCSEDETGVVYCMDVNGRCPFLREDNYCEIVLALGQEALGHVCATYPRSEDCLGCDVEMNLILSCPEAARQLLTKEAVTTFEEANVADEEFIPNEDYEEPEDLCYTEDEIKSIRSELISLMQDRSLSLKERILSAAKVCLEESVTGESDDTCVSPTCSSLLDPTYDGYLARTALLADLPWQTELWKPEYAALKSCVADETAYNDALENVSPAKLESLAGIDSEIAGEQMLVYYLFRYLPWAMEDGDLTGKLNMGLLSCLIIRDLTLKNVIENGGSLNQSCIIRAVNTWSKVLEYADDNLLYLFEA